MTPFRLSLIFALLLAFCAAAFAQQPSAQDLAAQAIAGLGDASAAKRESAAAKLIELNNLAVEKVEQALADGKGSPRAGVELARVLGKIGRPESRGVLAGVAKSPADVAVRFAALAALETLSAEDAKPVAVAWLGDANASLKGYAVAFAGRMALVEALPGLTALAKDFAQLPLADAAIGAIGAVIAAKKPATPESAAAVDAVAAVIADEKAPARLKTCAALALGAIKEPRGLKPLLDLAGSDAAAVAASQQRQAIVLLAGYGAEIYPDALGRLVVDSEKSPANIAFTQLCERLGRPAVPRLLATLKEADARVRANAHRTLVRLFQVDPQAIASLSPVSQIDPVALIALIPVFAEVQTPEVVDLLAPLLAENSATPLEQRKSAMKVLAVIADNASGSTNYRKVLNSATLIQAATNRLGDEDADVRRSAVSILESKLTTAYEAEKAATLAVVEKRFTLETDEVLLGRLAAVLAHTRGADAVQTLISLLAKVPKGDGRLKILKTFTTLPRTAELAEKVASAIADDFRVDDRPADIRLQALETLGWANNPQAAGLMQEVLSRAATTQDLKEAILKQFVLMAGMAASATPAVVDLLAKERANYEGLLRQPRTDENLRKQADARRFVEAAMDALAALRDARAVPALLPFVAPRADGLDLKALNALQSGFSSLPDVPKQVTPVLLKGLQSAKPDAGLMAVADKLAKAFPLAARSSAEKIRRQARGAIYLVAALGLLERLELRGAASETAGDMAKELLQNSDADVVRVAIRLCGKLKFSPSLRRLEDMLSTRPDMRAEIEAACRQIKPSWKPR